MIRMTQLDFGYRRSDFRLQIPELAVPRGSSVAVIGPSGSGKTTLLHLVAGIISPASGRVEIDGVDLSALEASARRDSRLQRIGLVFQEFELLEHLNVLDNILLPCRLSSTLLLDSARRERAAALAGEMGIGDKLRRYVRRLSQGERQRVAVCRALLLQPPLLLCDEPTGNLDPANKAHVLDLIFKYITEQGGTLLTVTHDHELLSRFDRTIDFQQLHRQRATTS